MDFKVSEELGSVRDLAQQILKDFTDVDQLKAIYDEALTVCPEDVVGLSVGTRPDCLDPEKIALLESYTRHLEVDLELGMESIHESTLSRGMIPHSEVRCTLDMILSSRLVHHGHQV